MLVCSRPSYSSPKWDFLVRKGEGQGLQNLLTMASDDMHSGDKPMGEGPPSVAGSKEEEDSTPAGLAGQAMLMRAVGGEANHQQTGEKPVQCSRCHLMVGPGEYVSMGARRNVYVCHPCHKSDQKAKTLSTSHPELVQSFLEMGQEDLKAFCKAHGDLRGAALAQALQVRVEHNRKLVAEEANKRRRVPQALSVLEALGYTKEHLQNIKETCESEWNPEIKDRFHCKCSLIAYPVTIIIELLLLLLHVVVCGGRSV